MVTTRKSSFDLTIGIHRQLQLVEVICLLMYRMEIIKLKLTQRLFLVCWESRNCNLWIRKRIKFRRKAFQSVLSPEPRAHAAANAAIN